MAESFSNSLTRSVGSVETKSGGTIGVTTTIITGITTTNVNVGDMVVNGNFNSGTKVSEIGSGQVTVDKSSTNTVSATSQNVSVLGLTTVFTATEKTILVAGTFANLTNNNINIYIEIVDNSASETALLASDIPIPSGSSFILSDAGKTVIEVNDAVRVYSDTDNSIDVTMSILGGVN